MSNLASHLISTPIPSLPSCRTSTSSSCVYFLVAKYSFLDPLRRFLRVQSGAYQDFSDSLRGVILGNALSIDATALLTPRCHLVSQLTLLLLLVSCPRTLKA